ncbi:hypothetical protein [Flexibacterium corallicola]|uniref:hypothetical protein n=1 Tax=Flexibacterium corallicola TaxID=3037259 RepID=UPI00286F5AA7|nr:hypothetical protein [Pseudovibrio sp. M1P-2-3]
MQTDFTLVHRATGRIDQEIEGIDIRANALLVVRPSKAPRSYEILYAPVELKEIAGGMYSFQTPHGEGRIRTTTLYRGSRVEILPYQPYMVLIGASGRTARIDRM